MAPDSGPQGAVLRYPYLWLSQSRAGEDSGRKERPVCLVLRVRDEKADLTHLALLAISSQPPASGQAALEIPDIDQALAMKSRAFSRRPVSSIASRRASSSGVPSSSRPAGASRWVAGPSE